MSKKTIRYLGIGYTLLTLLLHNVLNTAVGEFMMQISYFAVMVWIIWFIYSLLKFSVRQFFYNRKHRSE